MIQQFASIIYIRKFTFVNTIRGGCNTAVNFQYVNCYPAYLHHFMQEFSFVNFVGCALCSGLAPPSRARPPPPHLRPRAVRRPSSARRRVSVVGSPVVGASVACRGSGLPLVLRVPPASRARLGGRGRSGRLSAALASRRPTACLRPALGPSSRPASRSRPLPRHAPASLLRSPLLPAPLGARVRWLAVELGATPLLPPRLWPPCPALCVAPFRSPRPSPLRVAPPALCAAPPAPALCVAPFRSPRPSLSPRAGGLGLRPQRPRPGAYPPRSPFLGNSWCGLPRLCPLVPRPFGPSGAPAARALRLSCAPRFAAGARPSLWGSAGARLRSISLLFGCAFASCCHRCAPVSISARCARFGGRDAPPDC